MGKFPFRNRIWDIAKCPYYRSVLISGVSFMRGCTELLSTPLPPPPPPVQGGSGRPSILDKDKAATAILEMAGKTIHSKGLREPEEDT